MINNCLLQVEVVRFSFKNVANYALIKEVIWWFGLCLVILPQNLRRYRQFFVAR